MALYGFEGDDKLYGGSGNDLFDGGPGDDQLYGGRGDDTFIGGPGNDYIKDWSDSGGGGNNTFVYNQGDGHDRVDYYYYGHQNGDGVGRLRFGNGIAPADIEVRNNGENVVFELTDGSGSITYLRANRGVAYYCPDEVHFADGTVWKWSTMPRK